MFINALKNICVFIVSTVVLFLLMEVYFQVVEIELPYHTLSDKTGKTMNPGKRVTYFKEGFYLGEINEYGYLGGSYAYNKPDSILRIAIIGDSYTEGFHVFREYHFTSILENKLNRNGKKYEVLNFGIGNYDYNDMLVLYQNKVARFNPDVVIFMLNYKDLSFRSNFIPAPSIISDGDSLYIDYSFVESSTYKTYRKLAFVFEKSATVKALLNAYKLTKKDRMAGVVFGKFYNLFSRPEKNLDSAKKENEQLTMDPRVAMSFQWFSDIRHYFVFRENVPGYIENGFKEMGEIAYKIEPFLFEKLTINNIDYKNWSVTNTYGHWNHNAQPVVADYLYNLIVTNNEAVQVEEEVDR